MAKDKMYEGINTNEVSKKDARSILLMDVNLRNGNWRNFTGSQRKAMINGKEKVVNTEGNRNFYVFLDEKQAEDLTSRGVNVKWTKVRDEKDVSRPYLKVIVNVDSAYPPSIQVADAGRIVDIPPANLYELDHDTRITRARLLLNPYEYDTGKFTCYLQKGVFIRSRDPWAEMYDGLVSYDESDNVGNDPLATQSDDEEVPFN